MGYRSLSCHKCIYYFEGFCESRNSGKYFVDKLGIKCEYFKKKKIKKENDWIKKDNKRS